MTTTRGRIGIACVALGLALPTTAAAQAVRQDEAIMTPRMMALGGRAEALSSSTSAMFANPAAMIATRSYHGDAYAMYDPTVSRWGTGSSIVDSTRSAVAAGMSYFYSSVDTPGEVRHIHDTRMNVAVPIANIFGIGLSGRYLDASAGTPITGPRSVLQPVAHTGFTFDAGLFLRPIPQLQLSVSGYNLNNPQSTVAPLSMGAGVAVLPIPEITLVADSLIDFASYGVPRGRYSGGLELFVANHVPIRGGYSYDDIRGGSQAVTAGLGYLDENWGVEVGLRQAIVPEAQTTVMASLRFFYRPPAQ